MLAVKSNRIIIIVFQGRTLVWKKSKWRKKAPISDNFRGKRHPFMQNDEYEISRRNNEITIVDKILFCVQDFTKSLVIHYIVCSTFVYHLVECVTIRDVWVTDILSSDRVRQIRIGTRDIRILGWSDCFGLSRRKICDS